jgi:mono/diheme cytochrome c family protein
MRPKGRDYVKRSGFIIASALFVVSVVGSGQAQKTVWDGVYTEEQAKRGAELYAEKCSMCHGDSLGGVESAPALTGPAFYGNWEGETLNALFERIRQPRFALADAERGHHRAHAACRRIPGWQHRARRTGRRPDRDQSLDL